MAANQKKQTRISELAKDLGLKNKDILDVLGETGISGKSSSGTLDPDEFNLVMDTVTSRSQLNGIGDYIDGKITLEPKQPEPKKEQPKKPAKPEAPKHAAPKA